MKKLLFSFLFLGFFCSPAFAASYSMADYTCKEFLTESTEGQVYLAIWLDGYYSALSENTSISENTFTNLLTALIPACQKAPHATVFLIFEDLEYAVD